MHFPIALGARVEGGQLFVNVQAVQIYGQNVSGSPLHQVFGVFKILRTGRTFPLFIVTDSGWANTDEVGEIQPGSTLSLGAQFRADTLHWDEFTEPMTEEQFLQRIGAFEISVSIDDHRSSWSWTIEELRDAIERFRKDQEKQALERRRSLPPAVRKRAS
jgi:hypothetical protein